MSGYMKNMKRFYLIIIFFVCYLANGWGQAKYEVNIKACFKTTNNHMECSTSITYQIYGENGLLDDGEIILPGTIGDNTTRTLPDENIKVNAHPTRIVVNGYHRDHRDGLFTHCKTHGSGTGSSSVTNYPCPSTIHLTNFMGNYGGSGSYIEFTIKPVRIDGNDLECTLNGIATGEMPKDTKIKIEAPSGYNTSNYIWQYKIGESGAVVDLPSEYQGKNVIEICADDFIPDISSVGNNKIIILLNQGCSDIPPAKKEFDLIIEAPSIIGVNTIDPTCNTISNGEIIFELDRPLMDGEILGIGLYIINPETSSAIPISSDDIYHIEGNKYKIKGIDPGEYSIQIHSYLGDLHEYPCHSDLTDKYLRRGIKINNAPPFKIKNLKKFNPICYGDNDGAIEVSAEGGTGLYWIKCLYEDNSEYKSEEKAGVVTLANLPPGVFELELYDSSGCLFDEILVVDGLAEPTDRMYLFKEQTKEASLDENNLEESNGVLSISIDGGVAPYKVTWKTPDSEGTEVHSEQITGTVASLRNINSGTYFVEVQDSRGCKISMSLELPKAPEIHISLTQSGVIQCQEDETGELSVQITGGSAPFKYAWYKNGDKLLETPDLSVTEALSGLGVGTYQLMITDDIGSRAWSHEITLTELTVLSLSFETVMLRCRNDYDGYLKLTVSGGNAPYTYQWSTGGTGDKITNLAMGDYSVRVLDADGCPSSGVGTVSGPDLLHVIPVVTNPSCTNLANGKVQLSISGGTSPYQISWNGGAYTSMETLQNLNAGNCQYEVTDNYNCETITATVQLTDPEPVVASLAEMRYVTSFGGSDGKIIILVKGGTKPYTVTARSGAQSYNFQKSTIQPDESVLYEFNGLKSGDYIVEVKDANYLSFDDYSSCKGVVNVTIIEPPKLIVRAELTKRITCFGGNDGQFVAHAEGGVPLTGSMPYSYQWYKIVNGVKQAVNCVDSVFSEASHGRYQISIKDQYNVEAFAEIEIKEPPKIMLRFETTEVICGNPNSGSITSFASGGDGGLTYLWSTGETTPAIIEKPKGKYTLTVTDDRGCSLSMDTVIINPTEVNFRSEVFVQTCSGQNDGAIFLDPIGGKMPYTYRWSTGSDQMFVDSLSAGTYTVTVVDDNLCESDTSFIIPDLPPIDVKLLTLKQPRAMGYNDGGLSVEITGGNQPYKITWFDESENILFNDSLSIEGGKAFSELKDLPTGTYRLRIEDKNYQLSQDQGYGLCGCLHEFSVFLPEPPKLEVSISESHFVSCKGWNNGSVASNATGGVPFENGLPYRFAWYYNDEPFAADAAEATGLKAGTYKLKITDANDIEAWSEPLELGEPDTLLITLTASDLKCSRDKNGWAEVVAAGGTAPYSYEWSTGDTISRIDQVPRGTYMVWVKDSRACEQLGKIRIVQPDSIHIDAQLIPPVCNGGSDGSIRAIISGGMAPYRYEWSTGSTSSAISGLKTGSYTLRVSDVNECSYETETFYLTQPESVKINLGPDRQLCVGQGHEVEAVASEPAHTFKWYSPQGSLLYTGNTYTLSDPGTYRVKGTTDKGCEATGTVSISRDDKKVEAEFMVASKVPVNDDIHFVNITTAGSDSIRWIIPKSGAFTVVSQDPQTMQVVFNELGSYIFGMRSFYGGCYETVYKTITVMNKFDIEDYEEVDSPVLKVFNVYPNPAKERFVVDIELGKASQGTLLLIDSGTGKTVERRVLKNNKQFRETFDLSGSGNRTYVLHLIAPEVRSSLKVIVK